MTFTLRPLQDWTGGAHSVEASRFDTPWPKTVRLLEREVEFLGGTGLVVQFDSRGTRADGTPSTRVLSPRVRVLFDTRDGTLVFQAGRYLTWQDNVRAVALTLEALRSVDRWGATSGGAQYKGYLQLEAGTGATSVTEAEAVLRRWAGPGTGEDTPYAVLWRRARANAHPDRGGSADAFHAVDQAARTLGLLQ